MIRETAKSALTTAVRATTAVVGRRRVAYAARWLTNEVRFDQINRINRNGETKIQQAACRPGRPVILDVGAHFGEWTLSLMAQKEIINGRRRESTALSDPQVFAFEPSAHTYAVAARKLCGLAEVHQVALSSAPGTAALSIVHEGAGSNSLTAFSDSSRHGGETETVRLDSVDCFARARSLDEITLLKIDAEGHDLEVIKGASEMLDRRAIGLVQFEYNSRWIDSRSFLRDAFVLMLKREYKLGKITPSGVEVYRGWHHELETFREGNYLAFRPDWQRSLRTIEWWNS